MLTIFFRALLLYAVVVLFIRMMGKRQIGELQPFELVITLLIADLVATPMQNTGVPIVEGMIPVVALFAIHNLISLLSLKSHGMRVLFCGRPSVLVEKGAAMEKEMRKLNMSLPELMENLRVNNVSNIKDVYRATLETNGKLSVVLYNDAKPAAAKDARVQVSPTALPMTVVVDGKLDRNNLKALHINETDLLQALSAMGASDLHMLFMVLADQNGTLLMQKKGESHTQSGKLVCRA